MSDPEVHRELGAHHEAISSLKNDVHEVKVMLTEIKGTLDQTKGSIRTLMAVGTVGGAIGALLAKGVAMLKGGVL